VKEKDGEVIRTDVCATCLRCLLDILKCYAYENVVNLAKTINKKLYEIKTFDVIFVLTVPIRLTKQLLNIKTV